MNETRDNKPDEIKVIEEIVEGYWICPNCNAKNRGARQQCDACGAIRGENVQFFCDDNAPAITDEEELRKAKAGPDWICPFCSNTSPADAKNCTGCGCARSDGKNRQVKDVPPPGTEPEKSTEKKPAAPLPPAIKIGCSIFALLILIFTFLSCQEKAAKVEIVDTAWKRVIERAEFKTVQEQAWQNEVPAMAQKLSSAREIRSYKEIPDGFENVEETYTEKVKIGEKKVESGRKDLGNGRFEIQYRMEPQYREDQKKRTVRRQKYRKEPVYDEKVTYNINRWIDISPVEAKGTVEEPQWPDSKASGGSSPAVGDIKETGRKETYTVKARKVGDSKEFEFTQLRNTPLTAEQFMKLRKGTQWEAIVSGLGDLRDIKFDTK